MLTTLREQLRESGRAFRAVFGNASLRRVALSWAGTVCAYWLLLAVTGTDTMFAGTGAVFLLTALLLAGVSVERGAPAPAPRRSFVRDAFAGFGTVAHDARLRLIIGLYGTQTLVAGALNVLIVVAALELLDLGNAGIGYLNSAVGVGGLLGGLGALALIGRTRLASDFGAGLVLL